MSPARLIVPLLLRDDRERRFFYEEAGLGSVRAVLKAAASSSLRASALVLTDDPRGNALAEAAGLAAAEAAPPARTTHEDDTLAPELEAARQWAMTHAAPDETLLLASPRAPLLTPDLLDRAAALGAEPGPPVLSVAEPRDHPVQFRRHMRLLAAERIVFLRDDGDSSGATPPDLPENVRRTRPFPVQQTPAGAIGAEKDGMFRLATNGLGTVFLPASGNDLSADRPLWRFPGQGQAELLLASPALRDVAGRPGRAAAVAVPGPGEGAPVRLVERHGGLLLAWPPELPAQNAHARLLFLHTQESKARGGTAEAHTPRDLSPDAHADESFPAPGPDVFGALCLYLGQDAEGDFDLALPFEPDASVWRVDPHSRATIDAASGRTICGRQDFMDVLTPDGALLSARVDALPGLPDRLVRGDFRPLRLEPGRSLRVANEVDMLLAIVRGLGREAS